MAARFAWSQLVQWEKEAVRRRVPSKIEGLIPRNQLPNNRAWVPRSASFERNGERTVINHLWSVRVGFLGLFGVCFYLPWRIINWGWIEMTEQHNYNFDNIVYDKLSTRNAPYHCAVGWP